MDNERVKGFGVEKSSQAWKNQREQAKINHVEKQREISQVLKNQKGQVAIFVALIFQVLFVFFAMIVNVGLLVHHKINLQNSVDLAAYYGAMKQAEMLNAIAHVNYQIRQSFKLLTFRYQQFGSAGTAHSPGGQHPYRPGVTGVGSPGQILRDDDNKVLSFQPAFCLPYTPVDIVNQQTESYCKEIKELKVPLPGVPVLGPNLDPTKFQESIIQLAQTITIESQKFCRYAMATNWIQLAKFIAAYKEDIRNRKKLLLGLANELSKPDPRDIQGDPIRQGIYRTLIKNLSYPNRDGLVKNYGDFGVGTASKETEFKFINSFSLDECRGNPTEISPPDWLSEVLVFPLYAMFDGICNDSKNITFKESYFNTSPVPQLSPNIPPTMAQFAHTLAQKASDAGSLDPNYLLYRTSLGFEKNPWCVGYVGVSATTTPLIPFSPQGAVTLKATAYAKPFGGRIGPWYGTTWSHQDSKSDSGKLTDAVLPIRVEPQIDMGTFNPQELIAKHRVFVNHSRYLGDTFGVLSELTIAHFARAIHERMGSQIRLQWFNHITEEEFDDKNSMGDILAWDKTVNKPPPMRDLEIAAIAPDHFDTSTYSIDPDFYNNYLTKIQKGYGSEFDFSLRGDLGSRMQGSDQEKRFSVRNQIESLTDSTKQMVDAQSKLTYYLNKFSQLLTSWQQSSPDSYVLDKSRFGICDPNSQIKQDQDPKWFTSGSCKAGGRTGYSVKLVDGKFLRNEVNGTPKQYELGGPGKMGTIKNPPPDNF